MKSKNILIALAFVLVAAIAALYLYKPKNKGQRNDPPADPGDESDALVDYPTKGSVPAPKPVKPTSITMQTGSFPLKMGSKGKLVQMIQVIVGVKPDGIWGKGTENAVQSKLKTNSIDAVKFMVYVSAKSGTPDFPLKLGSKGNYVKAVQILTDQKIDGIFGNATRDAVYKITGNTTVTQDDFTNLVKRATVTNYMAQNYSQLTKMFNF